MKGISVFTALFLLTASVFAINLIEPFNKEVTSNDIIDLGEMGPGQTIVVSVEPIVSTGGKFNQGGQYDQAIATSLPEGWKTKPSKLYGKPLQVEVTANKDAAPGDYNFNVIISDEKHGDGLEDVNLNAKVKISWDVLDVSVDNRAISAGPGQPARYIINIKNKGTASDVFEVNSFGTKRSEFKKYVYVPAKSSKQLSYEITEKEEGDYTHNLNVVSTASENIKKHENVTLSVKTDLIGDYKATNNGVIIFPIFENLISSLAGLISNLF